ncbi:Alpha/Beta hydrolase protein [Pavlovales sp. CCMP2436]|nr:Alpha/Beta hydrolase protein [Pavlovales sp. CCMP2436]
MRRFTRCLSVGALSVGAALAASPRAECAPRLQLASTLCSPHQPTVVLVHGLDSCRETWKNTLAALSARGVPSLALDLRGHGESPLGDVADFSASELALDVLGSIRGSGVSSALLVGHSMGGRIAMRAAALDALSESPVLRGVVIEDMDLRVRPFIVPPSSAAAEQALARFGGPDGHRFASFEEAEAALLPFYDAPRVAGWRGTRVRQLFDGSWWSDISPLAQRLARETVLASNDGGEAWDALGVLGVQHRLSVDVWHAPALGTVCALTGDGSIEDMAARLPCAEVREFAKASHSVHNSNHEEFIEALCVRLRSYSLS